MPILAGFNSGEIRSLRFLAPPVPADAATYEAAIRERYGDLADDVPAALSRSDHRPRACSPPRATRSTAGPPSGWRRSRRRRVSRASSIYSITAIRPPTSPACTPSTPRVPYVFGTADRTPPLWPKVPATPAETAAVGRDAGLLGQFRAQRRADAAGQPPGRPMARRAPTWPSKTRRSPATHLMPGMYELQRAGRVPPPRARRHPLELERRHRLAAAARRTREHADDRRRHASPSR